jgi:hypothetical protein
MLMAFALIRRLDSKSLPARTGTTFPANDNVRTARRADMSRACHNRVVLVCQRSLGEPGAARLVCRWRRDAGVAIEEPLTVRGLK